MTVRCEFYLENGDLNLDLTSKIIRREGVKTSSFSTDASTVHSGYNPLANATISMKEIKTLTESSGAFSPGALTVLRGTDSSIYWFTAMGDFCTTADPLREVSITENWANDSPVKYKDYMKIYREDGLLLWSTGTLGDATFRCGQVWLSAINQVATFTSPNNRRVYILADDLFKSGVYVDDGTTNAWSASGLTARWSNNGRTVEVAYSTWNDGDMVNFMNKVQSAPVTFFEFYDDY
ncbi:hypothetical protein C9426_00875 [Serratia sp. S1B]|nr:hypothetical protein C9426_00875 [Serratia sp. S1B]